MHGRERRKSRLVHCADPVGAGTEVVWLTLTHEQKDRVNGPDLRALGGKFGRNDLSSCRLHLA